MAHGVQHEGLDALGAVGGLQHFHGAHVLAAEALGREGQRQAVARCQLVVDDSRGVVAGVVPVKYRVGRHRFAQIALPVALPHAFLNGVLQRAAGDVHILPQLHAEHGHARILTHGHALLRRQLIVFDNASQDTGGQRPLLLRTAAL